MLLQMMANYIDPDVFNNTGSKSQAVDVTDFIPDAPTADLSTRLPHPQQQLVDTEASDTRSPQTVQGKPKHIMRFIFSL